MWQNGEKGMKHKHFYVVTYDISDTKRRDKVVKTLEAVGDRVNLSVFECMLTDVQYRKLCERLAKLVQSHHDRINVYPICTECYARIRYIPAINTPRLPKILVV